MGEGRSSLGVQRPAAQRAVSGIGAVACSHCSGWFGSAGWSLSDGARRRRVVPRGVALGSVSCVRAWPHSMEEIQMCWPFGVLAGSPEDEVYDGLVETLPRAGQVPEGLDGELGRALLQAVPAQGSVWGPALEDCSEE